MGGEFECCIRIMEGKCIEYGLECLTIAQQRATEATEFMAASTAIVFLGIAISVVIITREKKVKK